MGCTYFKCKFVVAQNVLGRKHQLHEKSMQVSLYFAEMGIIPPGHDTSVPGSNIPTITDISLKDDKVHTFILKSEKLRRNIDKVIKKLYATVDWDFSAKDGKKLRVMCELKYNTPNVNQLAKTWQSNIETSVDDIMKDFSNTKLDVLQDFWSKFVEQAQSDLTNLFDRKKEVLKIYLDDKNNYIELVGLKDEVANAMSKLQQILLAIEEEVDNAKKTVTEVITNFKRRHIDLFIQLKTFEEIKQSFNVNASFDIDKAKISLTGLSDHVRKAKLQLYASVSGFSETAVQIAPELANILMLEDDVRKNLCSLFHTQLFIVGWDLEDGLIKLCTKSDNDATEIAKICTDNLMRSEFQIETPMKAIILNEKWTNKQKKEIILQGVTGNVHMIYSDLYTALKLTGALSSPVILFIDGNCENMVFCGITTPVVAAKEIINEYLLDRAIYETFIATTNGKAKMLAKHFQNEIRNVEDLFKQYNVTVRVLEETKRVVLRGKKAALDQNKNSMPAVNAINNLLQSICKDNFFIKDEAMIKFVTSERGQFHLRGLETKYPVVIVNAEHEGGIIENDSKSQESPEGESTQGEICTVSLDDFAKDDVKRIYVFKGNLAIMKLDAIVNAANENLQLLGGLAGDIKKWGNF